MSNSQTQNKLQQQFPGASINSQLLKLPRQILQLYRTESQMHIKTQDFEYEGKCLYMLPNGKGKMQINKIGFIEGQFQLGYPIGIVILKTDNYIYQGELDNWKPTGKGVLKQKEFYYEGDFKDGQMTGKGKILFEDGSLYQGDVNNGVRQGYGELIDTNGSKYQGQWQNDVAQGDGKFIDVDGKVTVGVWKQNQLVVSNVEW